MYIYPFKIFALSKNKRTLAADCKTPVGIYDTAKYSLSEAKRIAKEQSVDVSVLLGEVSPGLYLMCLDLDDCFVDGKMDRQTEDFLKEFSPSEYEVSSSGEGIHVFILTYLELETFIIKDMEGCKSFECYTNKRHIVTVDFDFDNTNLTIGKHDEFILQLYEKAQKLREAKNSNVEMLTQTFKGAVTNHSDDVLIASAVTGRKPVEDMYTLRGCGYKDTTLISIIDEVPEAVDQSAHDARLIRKLMYYTLSFDGAWELAKKTNYYKAKDARHKKKFDDPVYKERTRRYLL